MASIEQALAEIKRGVDELIPEAELIEKNLTQFDNTIAQAAKGQTAKPHLHWKTSNLRRCVCVMKWATMIAYRSKL